MENKTPIDNDLIEFEDDDSFDDDSFDDDMVDLKTDSMEKINKNRVAWIESVLFCMQYEDRLCDKTSSAAVEEFQFRGNKSEVEAQLKSLRDSLINTPYTEQDRQNLIDSNARYCAHVTERANFPIQKAYFETVKKMVLGSGDEAEMKILGDKVKKNYDNIHDKKECICFNNK